MKNLFYVCYLFLSIQTLTGQELVTEITTAFTNTKNSNHKKSFAIPNNNNKDVLYLFEAKKELRAHLYDKNHVSKATTSTTPLPKKYQNLLGHSINENHYNLFFSNEYYDKFGVLSFDFETQSATQNLLKFKFKKERFIESLNYNNNIYILTISKFSSNLNIYTFDKDFVATKRTISLKNAEYKSTLRSYKYSVYDLLMASDSNTSYRYINIGTIKHTHPNVLNTASKKIKLYHLNNQLIFSFDISMDETHVYTINLDDFTSSYNSYDKPSKNDSEFKESNSFIFDQKIFHIASSLEKMIFTISDLQTREVLKTYSAQKEKPIDFKNTPIIQEGGSYYTWNKKKVREMEKTSKYLRKISNSNIGVSVYKINGFYNVLLGGTEKIQRYKPPTLNTGSVSNSTLQFTSLYFNPLLTDFYQYTTTKSTYINSLLDKNLEHTTREIPKNTYDKINDFESNISKITAKNIFKYDGKVFYGYYDLTSKKYLIYKF